MPWDSLFQTHWLAMQASYQQVLSLGLSTHWPLSPECCFLESFFL